MTAPVKQYPRPAHMTENFILVELIFIKHKKKRINTSLGPANSVNNYAEHLFGNVRVLVLPQIQRWQGSFRSSGSIHYDM